MKALLLAFLAGCCVVVLRAEDAAAATNQDILALRQSFPDKGDVRDDIYSACQQWFLVVSTLPAAKEALRHAQETRDKFVTELTTTKNGMANAKAKAVAQVNLKWLKGAFTDYLDKWADLTGPTAEASGAPAPKAPTAGQRATDVAAVIKAATHAAKVISEIQQDEASFLNGHGLFKGDLGWVALTTKQILDANGAPTQAQADTLRSSITISITEAQAISTRESESDAAKSKANELMVKLRTL